MSAVPSTTSSGPPAKSWASRFACTRVPLRGLQYQARPGAGFGDGGRSGCRDDRCSSVFVIGHISFSGLLLRHPNLRVILAESALGWSVLYMEKADHEFRQDGSPEKATN